jgi:hypothetical protein
VTLPEVKRCLPFLFRLTCHPVGRVRLGAGDSPRPTPASKSSRSPRSGGRHSGIDDGFSPNSPVRLEDPLSHSSGKIQDTGSDTLPAAIVSIQKAGEFLNRHPPLYLLLASPDQYKVC